MEKLWKPDLGDGKYMNPVVNADYSDPDLIRVDDTYYMTASSFNYTPGLPILTSKDMVNWILVNYATGNVPYINYDTPQHAKGVWAPAIRYHEGEFYIYYGMPDEGIFMVKTKDPLGKWDEPVLVLEGKGLIDSCPFWDDDGRAYIVHGYARSRIGFKSFLGIFEMSWDGTKAISEDHLIYNGLETNPTIEGPKVYKRNGYYYIFAPAGGVKKGWQTVLRSKDIHGPFEEKVVMRQGDSPINGPHQGGLVSDVDGNEWFVHFQDAGYMGRVCHLQHVTWKNDWPIIGEKEKDGCGQPSLTHIKPACHVAVEPTSLEASDDFKSDKLDLMWQWTGNNRDDFYELSDEGLKLYSLSLLGEANTPIWYSSNVLTQKLVTPKFKATVELDVTHLGDGDQAGFTMFGGSYCYVADRVIDNVHTLIYVESQEIDEQVTENVTVIRELAANENVLSIEFTFTDKFAAKVNGVEVDTSFMPSDHQWVGAKLGLFSTSIKEESKNGYGLFKFIHVERID